MQVDQPVQAENQPTLPPGDFPPSLVAGVTSLLEQVYGGDLDVTLANQVMSAFWAAGSRPKSVPRLAEETAWSERDTYVITYGGTFVDGEHKPLDLLHDFLTRYLEGTVTGVHILPYFPFTSDDGFSVTDYREVNSQLGAWDDIGRIASHFRLMSDLVINHCSSQSWYFNEYLQGHEPYDRFFFEADPMADLSAVVRPRASGLLRKVSTASGDRHVWCTFSHDQIDFNFANPEVLLEFVRILRFHVDRGVRTLRLDAVAFLWKQVGSPSIHLPETHAIIRLLRLLADHNDEPLMLITETNVPNAENLSYFGNANEAHAVYNFSLPPLLLHALHNGTAEYLNEWQLSMPPLQPGCTYFNFTASHDGIGLRPAEGYLSDRQIDELIETVRSFGGLVSLRQVAGNARRPYEINTSLYDALMGTVDGVDQWNEQRFLCSQIVAMGLQGIPGIYVHSLLATHNDHDGVEKTGHNRAINRHRWNYPEIREYLDGGENVHSRVFAAMKDILAIRMNQPAFHPDVPQFLLQLPNELFGFRRHCMDHQQEIFAIHNLSDRHVSIPAMLLNLHADETWSDILAPENDCTTSRDITFEPYQCRWISNRISDD